MEARYRSGSVPRGEPGSGTASYARSSAPVPVLSADQRSHTRADPALVPSEVTTGALVPSPNAPGAPGGARPRGRVGVPFPPPPPAAHGRAPPPPPGGPPPRGGGAGTPTRRARPGPGLSPPPPRGPPAAGAGRPRRDRPA